MKQIFTDVKSGEIVIMDLPSPVCKKGGILVKTYYSLVSAGTERMLIDFGRMNLLQKAKTRPDQIKKVFEKMQTDGIVTTLKAALNKLDEPLPLGYSAMGEVIGVGEGCPQFTIGDNVAIAGTLYANHAEINYVPKNLSVKLPNSINNVEEAAFIALGAIAIQGIKQAEVQPGEKVAVIGLGLLGQIASQILNAYANTVIGIDIDDFKGELGRKYVHHFINANAPNILEQVNYLTNGFGADKIIITAASESNQPIELAGEIARDRAIISMVGVTQMEIPRRSYYQKELSVKLARSYGPGRYDCNYEEKGIDYPIGQVRWTENRIMEEFVRLLSENKLYIKDLISHRFPLEKAKEAYELITQNLNNEKYTGILFEYSKKVLPEDKVLRKETKAIKGIIGVGLIGAGGFARSVILPNMRKIKDFHFVGLATTTSTTAGQTLKNYEFDYCANDYKKLLEDENIDLVVIATQHNTHARITIEALDAGKHVYVEKPLAITMGQLEEVKRAYERNNQHLFVGFNRRYSPFAKFIKENLQTDKYPCMIQYTVNAGYIPKDNWVHDPEIGGGRIIGEACHFVDLAVYLTGSKPVEKSSFNIRSSSEHYTGSDNVSINVYFENGSVANIVYTSMGAKSFPKERVTVFCNGNVGVIDNFVKAEIFGNRKKKLKKSQQDKGFLDEYNNISYNLKNSKSSMQEFQSAFVVSKILLRD